MPACQYADGTVVQQSAGGARRRARRLPPEERRKRLLASAIEAFAQTGIGAAVHADVAHAAAVSVPTVFIYFQTREILVSAVITETERFLLQLMTESMSGRQSAPDRVGAILRAFARAVDEHPHHIKVWMDWSTIVAAPTWPRYVAFQDRILAEFAELIEQGKAAGEIHGGIDTAMGAHLIMGSGHMIAQMKFRHRDDDMVEHFIETVVERALFEASDRECRAGPAY